MSDVRTDNDFLWGSKGGAIQPLMPVRITTKQQAFRAAAWLATMGEMLTDEDPPTDFDDVLAAVRNT